MEIPRAEIVDRIVLTSGRFALASVGSAEACHPKLGTTFLTGFSLGLILNGCVTARLRIEVVQAFIVSLYVGH